MGSYLFLILYTHHSCRMIFCSHLAARWGNPHNLVVIGWTDEEGFLRIQVVGV